MDSLFNNSEKIEALKNYIYNNNLPEKEINKVFNEFCNNAFIKGLDCGAVVQKNTAKRIEQAKVRMRDNGFEKIFEELEEEQSRRVLTKNK